jgi:hypothetical protein
MVTLGVVTIQPAIADHEDAILEMISLRAGTFALERVDDQHH